MIADTSNTKEQPKKLTSRLEIPEKRIPNYKPPKTSYKEDFKKNWILYLLFLVPLTYFIIFHYMPMFGIVMAFQDFSVAKGFLGSEWIGMANFIELFRGDQFTIALRNTAVMASLNLTIGFVAPVILGLFIAQVRHPRISRGIQTMTYLPYFVSAVVAASLAQEFLSENGGLTQVISMFGYEKQNWIANNGPSFWLINTLIGVWQGAGYGSIIYIAAIKNVNPELYEAASVDGANRWQQIFKITLPSVIPVIVMMFTIQIGVVFKIGFDKILLLYLPSTYEYSDVLYTYTYRMAFSSGSDFGLSTASGLFQSVISMILLFMGNYLSRKVTDSSLF